MPKPQSEFLQELFKKNKNLKEAFRDPRVPRRVLRTGIYSLDDILGGGFQGGTYVEIFGQESVGKSYLAMHAMGQCQRLWDKDVAYLDFENTWDPDRAEQVGVDLDRLAYFRPESQEQGYDFLRVALGSRPEPYGMVVIDSISGMTPDFEMEHETARQTMANQARNNSKGFRTSTPGLQDTIVIIINQIRDNMSMFGQPTVTAGGRALKHYAHMRLQCRKSKLEGEGYYWDEEKFQWDTAKKVPVGHTITVQMEKSKLFRPGLMTTLEYNHELQGIDFAADAENFLGSKGFIRREGNYYIVAGDGKKLNGKPQLRKWILNNPNHVRALLAIADSYVAKEPEPQDFEAIEKALAGEPTAAAP